MLQGGGRRIPVETKKKERRVYLASARHKVARWRKKGGWGDRQEAPTKGGKLSRRGVFFVEQKRGNKGQ